MKERSMCIHHLYKYVADQFSSPKRRKLSDEELDSGDDVDRRDRIDGDDVDMRSLSDQEKELLVARMDLARHGMPRGSDGEVRSFTPTCGYLIIPTSFIYSAILNSWLLNPKPSLHNRSKCRLLAITVIRRPLPSLPRK